MRRRTLIVIAVAVCGCAYGAPDRALTVTTDKASYSHGDAVAITLVNVSDRHVSMSGCPSAPQTIVDQKISGSWVDIGAFNATCLPEFSYQTITLPPGDRWEFSLTALDVGTYRLRVFQGSRILGISNDFEAQ